MSDKPILLAPEQAAQMLSIPISRLARWRSKSVGPSYIKIEGRVLYDLDDLLAFLNGSQVRMDRREIRRKNTSSNAKTIGCRPELAEADHIYFKNNSDAEFRVRRWTDEDASCGTTSFDGRGLTKSMVLVFRCGARIPANMPPGDPEGLVMSNLLTRFASKVLATLPECGQDWPQ